MMQRLDDDDGVFEEAVIPQQSAPVVALQEEVRFEIPEPVLSSEEDESVEEVDVLVEEVDEPVEEVDEPVDEIEPVFKKAVAKKIERQPKETIQPQPMPLPANIETSHGFEIRLPPGKLEAILKSIASTPHDGYKPVIGLHENGKIVIDWIAL